MLVTGAATAQENGGEAERPRVHYSYAHQGTGHFSLSGRSTQVVRMPFSWRLRQPEKGRWGLKVRLPVSVGVHDFEIERPLRPELKESVETIAVTPGVELEIPLRESWRVRPYAELGVGGQIRGDVHALLWEAGVKSLWSVPRESLEVHWGGALKREGFRLLDGDDRDSYGVADLGLELRWPDSFQVRGKAADPGIYLIARRFLPGVEFVRLDGDRRTVRTQLEAGVTLGTRPGLSLWGVELPRVGLAYRWGDGLSAVRLNFGFPF